MALADAVGAAVRTVVRTEWNITNGLVVPKTENVTLHNGAVKVDATYLYADLADSTKAAQTLKPEVTAKIIRSFLNAAVRVIRHFGGQVRSFDGDRVMAIYMGEAKNTSAAKTALGINWAVNDIVWPELTSYWPTLPEYWSMRHGVGIDTGEALVVRGGVRNNNDLVSVGNAPNIAAKLSEVRGSPRSFITDAVYRDMHESCYTGEGGRSMWERTMGLNVGSTRVSVWSSTWQWEP